MPVALNFSVDRTSTGAPGTAVATQAALNQQPGDIFQTTAQFAHPGNYVGTLVGPGIVGTGYVGGLPAFLKGPRNNTLLIDEMTLGLLAGAALVPANLPANPIQRGTHDNVDGYEQDRIAGPTPPMPPWPPGGAADWTYFTIYPDEAALVQSAPPSVWPANIWDVMPGAPGTVSIVPFATSVTLGLDLLGQALFDDSIDALVMFDRGQPGGPMWGGPGAEPGIDYALFSLAPGSISLTTLANAGFQVNDADIFFTDFTGLFALYASSLDLGLQTELGGGIFVLDNVDAVDLYLIPEPCSVALLATGLAGLCLRRRRRK